MEATDNDEQQAVNSTHSCKTNKCLQRLAKYLDCLFVTVVIGGLVVVCWWSTWSLMDHLLFPDNATLSSWTSFSIGAAFSFVFILLQDVLVKRVDGGTVIWYVLTRLHTYVYSIAVIQLWRGSWGLVWVYAGATIEVYAITWLVTCLILWIFRISYSMVTAPLALVLDIGDKYYYISTRYLQEKAGIVVRTLEIMATILLQAVVALVWFAVWGVTDCLFYPDDPVMSAYMSLIAAASLILIVYVLHYPAYLLSKRTGKLIPRVILEDAWFMLQHVAVLQYWRGLWLLYASFILPDVPPMGPVIGHIVSFACLNCMLCGYSVAIVGMSCINLDGNNVDGGIFRLPAYFKPMLDHFKTLRHLNAEEEDTHL